MAAVTSRPPSPMIRAMSMARCVSVSLRFWPRRSRPASIRVTSCSSDAPSSLARRPDFSSKAESCASRAVAVISVCAPRRCSSDSPWMVMTVSTFCRRPPKVSSKCLSWPDRVTAWRSSVLARPPAFSDSASFTRLPCVAIARTTSRLVSERRPAMRSTWAPSLFSSSFAWLLSMLSAARVRPSITVAMICPALSKAERALPTCSAMSIAASRPVSAIASSSAFPLTVTASVMRSLVSEMRAARLSPREVTVSAMRAPVSSSRCVTSAPRRPSSMTSASPVERMAPVTSPARVPIASTIVVRVSSSAMVAACVRSPIASMSVLPAWSSVVLTACVRSTIESMRVVPVSCSARVTAAERRDIASTSSAPVACSSSFMPATARRWSRQPARRSP